MSAAGRQAHAYPLWPTVPLVALAYAGGGLAAGILGGPWWATLLLASITATALRVNARVAWLPLIAAVALAGAAHARFEAASTAEPSAPTQLADTGAARTITGIARDDARVRGTTQHLDLDVTHIDGQPHAGGVRVTTRATAEVRAGDRVAVAGRLEAHNADPERLAYASYLRERGIEAVVLFPERVEVTGGDTAAWPVDALRAVRRWSLANLERALPEPEASLAAGVLLGEQRSMPAALTEALRTTGTTHLVVVSGQNVALVTGAVVALLTLVMSRRRAGLVALFALPAYVVLVGASAPVLRAAVMAVGIALAAAGGRRTPAWIFLAYAVAGMLAFQPRLATDVSFQLSAAATAGVLLIAPPLRDLALARVPQAGFATAVLAALVEASMVAVGAAVAVLPVQAAAFGTASLVQVPANALVAPLYEGTLLVALAAALLGWLPPVAWAIEVAGRLVPGAFIALVETLARVPGASVSLGAPLAVGVVWCGLVVMATWWLYRRATGGTRPHELPRLAPRVGTTAALAVVAGGLWLGALAPAEELPSVTVLDVGQGLAVLVRDGGAAVLVDAGPPDGAVIAALGRAGQRDALNAVVLSHDDLDHTGGADEVRRRLGAVRVFGPRGEALDIGDRIRIGTQTVIEVLAPPVVATDGTGSDNDRGLVLRVTIGERRLLLPADIEAAGERWLVTSGQQLRADVLVVPHHGSKTSSSADFVAAVAPRLAVVSAGAKNSYGHPAPEVLARYAGVEVYRTDQHGEVTLRSDGRRLWVDARK